MSLENIIESIRKNASSQSERIIQEATKEAQQIIREANMQAQHLYHEILEKEKALYERQKQIAIVNTKLKNKNEILKIKQEFIESVFAAVKASLKNDMLKKQQITPEDIREVPEDLNFFLNKLRQEYETDLANILFG